MLLRRTEAKYTRYYVYAYIWQSYVFTYFHSIFYEYLEYLNVLNVVPWQKRTISY